MLSHVGFSRVNRLSAAVLPKHDRPPIPRPAGATALIEQGYSECGLELGAVILDVAQEADKEAARGNGQPLPGDLVRGRLTRGLIGVEWDTRTGVVGGFHSIGRALLLSSCLY